MLVGSFGLFNCFGLCGGFFGLFIFGVFEDCIGVVMFGLWFVVVLLIIGVLVFLFFKSFLFSGFVLVK